MSNFHWGAGLSPGYLASHPSGRVAYGGPGGRGVPVTDVRDLAVADGRSLGRSPKCSNTDKEPLLPSGPALRAPAVTLLLTSDRVLLCIVLYKLLRCLSGMSAWHVSSVLLASAVMPGVSW